MVKILDTGILHIMHACINQR